MKRTVLEIMSGLIVLVLLASLHHQVAHLQSQDQDVDALRSLVRTTIANSSSKQEIRAIRSELLSDVDSRMGALGKQVDAANQGIREASGLRGEVDAARREADLLKAKIIQDASHTRQLMDSYQDEFRTREHNLEASLRTNREVLEQLASKVAVHPEILTREMLLPTVQLNGDDTVGSGTLVKSAKNPETGEVESYILTSYHVVRNIYADSPHTRKDGIIVNIYGSQAGQDLADLISYDDIIDAALIKLRSDTLYERVARVLPRGLAKEVQVWDPVYAIGCPLGNDPVPTGGTISSKSNVLNGTNYWMINAPTYYGNSGGGVFLGESYYLIGIFSKIYTHGRGTPVVVPHMGLCTPIDLVYGWLEREGHADVIDQPADVDQVLATLRYSEPTEIRAAAPGK